MEQNIQSASGKQLVQAVERLSPAELDDFVDQVAALRARRHAPMLSDDESALFAVINQSLPESEVIAISPSSWILRFNQFKEILTHHLADANKLEPRRTTALSHRGRVL